METLALPPQPTQRKKLWHIDGCYKCALIGTCLSRAELRKLSRERQFAAEPGLDDYQLHAHFIKISDQDDDQAKALGKYLEKKYRSAAKKYLKAETDRAIKALWDEDLAEGRVDSAWWGILTHPQASLEIVAKVYGALHMLGHDYAVNAHKDRALIGSLRAKTDMLEEVVGSERQFFRQEKKQLREDIFELHRKLAHGANLAKENEGLREKIAALDQRFRDVEDQRREENNQQLIAELRQNNNGLYGRIDELTEELDLIKRQFSQAVARLQELEQLRGRLERHESEQTREIASLEGMLFQHIAKEQDPCLQCADQNTDNCPGPNLCGKTVLYVGGLHKMVPHYRQLVEQFGGRFLHHDGGKEASRNLLPKLMSTADAVLCPIDCVSHDACNCVKKICKRYQKPFVLMRSSGLSSLARGLNQIIQ